VGKLHHQLDVAFRIALFFRQFILKLAGQSWNDAGSASRRTRIEICESFADPEDVAGLKGGGCVWQEPSWPSVLSLAEKELELVRKTS
jgi:hypothetical protein